MAGPWEFIQFFFSKQVSSAHIDSTTPVHYQQNQITSNPSKCNTRTHTHLAMIAKVEGPGEVSRVPE
jgi:hypothetical protein